MAVDPKYGKVTVEKEPGNPFGEDEPVFILRGRDLASPDTIYFYRANCAGLGATPEHLEAVEQVYKLFTEWQGENQDLLKVPD